MTVPNCDTMPYCGRRHLCCEDNNVEACRQHTETLCGGFRDRATVNFSRAEEAWHTLWSESSRYLYCQISYAPEAAVIYKPKRQKPCIRPKLTTQAMLLLRKHIISSIQARSFLVILLHIIFELHIFLEAFLHTNFF